MLKRFTVKNYKNFKDEISINFEKTAGYQFNSDCITDGLISKMLIYGRNSTGKTNLGNAIMDIGFTGILLSEYSGDDYFLNADSSEKSAQFTYVFQFGASELIYKYNRLSSFCFCYEELIVDKEEIFTCDYEYKRYNFDGLKKIEAETANTERFIQSMDGSTDVVGMDKPQLSFLNWLYNNVALKKDSLIVKLFDYIQRMTLLTTEKTGFGITSIRKRFNDYLGKSQNLQDLEDFLNAMGIECKLVLKQLPDDRKKLYFAHEKLVPFYQTASSGTLALVELYRKLISRMWNASFLYLDEFDAFYHYEMSENVIGFFKKKYPQCQIIMTTHNTNLMTNRLMRPDCIFILSTSGKLTALCNATERELREGHNLEKMYISGEFEKYE